MEALVATGHKVELFKVKAHTRITGNEKADEAAKQACTTGALTEAWDNDEPIKIKPMVPDGDSGSKELKGKHADQAEQTEEEQTIIHDHTPNAQQQADQTRDEEERQLHKMLRQQEEEEMVKLEPAEF
ncbi:hypothetical protein CYMTET_50180 [Cymbomonas tetramitiformis]|uniref:RNase H type-1 domain-containing protein n=1 Tax=Cymbomonas tetramitiformis TaxID=36881 RepID=A0AAE0BNR3_9CHLO|nr:hypothetical protein CYMTET_50180 [Cymbomonas tetramitiformis]